MEDLNTKLDGFGGSTSLPPLGFRKSSRLLRSPSSEAPEVIDLQRKDYLCVGLDLNPTSLLILGDCRIIQLPEPYFVLFLLFAILSPSMPSTR